MTRHLVVAHQTADSPTLMRQLKEMAARDPAADFQVLAPVQPLSLEPPLGGEVYHGPYESVVISMLPHPFSEWLRQDVPHRLARRHPDLRVIHVTHPTGSFRTSSLFNRGLVMGEPPCYEHLLTEDGQIREVKRVRIRRIYELAPDEGDEARVLVDRIWPRGISKTALRLDGWFRDLAPSTELRRWYGHDVSRWPEFRERYRTELADLARRRPLVLLYSARDQEHNQAAVLREAIEEALDR